MTITRERTVDVHVLWAAWNESGSRSDHEALLRGGEEMATRIVIYELGVSPKTTLGKTLVAAGMTGFLRALERFDVSRGWKFQTYAKRVVRGAILDEARGEDALHWRRRQWVKRLMAAEESLTSRHGRRPTDEEIAGYLRVTVDKVASIQRDALEGQVVFFATMPETTSEASRSTSNAGQQVFIGAAEATPPPQNSAPVDYEVLQTKLQAALDTLQGIERVVMVLFYIEKLGMKEIANTIGVSPPMVSKIRDRAFAKVIAALRG